MIKNILLERRYDNGVRIDVAKVVFSNGIMGQIKSILRMRSELQDYDLDFPLEVSAILAKKVKTAEELNVELIVEKEQNKALVDENKALLDRMQGLVPPPVQGATWNESKNYINGDVVKHMGDDYKAKRYSRGKAPDLHPDCWKKMAAEAVEPAVWTGLEHGATIEVGTIVNYDNCKWRCLKEHKKSNVRKPAAFSDYWAQV